VGWREKESLPVHVMEMDVTDDASVERRCGGGRLLRLGGLMWRLTMRGTTSRARGGGYY